jgi:predicted deacylase
MSGRVLIEREVDGVAEATRFVAQRGDGGLRVAIVGHVHGNERVGGLTIARFHEVVCERLTRGSVLTLIANLDARAIDQRHTPDGRDMNRLWHKASLKRLREADPEGLCSEERRVLEVAPLLLGVDVILDLHSTSRPSPPHLVFRDDLRHAELGTRLGVKRMVTGIHEGAILGGGVCPDIGLDPGEPSDRLGFTLEAGEHHDPRNLGHAWDVVVRLLVELGMWDEVVTPVSPEYEVYEVVERYRQAPAGSPPYRFVEAAEALAASRRGPVRQLESFEPVEADEGLMVRRTGEVVRAEAPFTMLMPCPTAKPGEDLFYFCQRRHAALQARPQTDSDAQREASAIERMLDLLGDDDAQRGGTVVSFHARRTMDLCAELIARTARLPERHPHRRLVVVGRGVDDVDEAEARVIKRYQTAMRIALDAGVPIDRVQLLRGASLGWLRQLAEQASGEDRSALRLFLSARHPHTVSLLLAGDPERAFADGDFHQVRVALLIEATAVEPEGDGVRVRMARAGLFGARPELVRLAVALINSLKQEHAHLLADEAIGGRAVLAESLDADGAIHMRTPARAGERDASAALRGALLRSQIDSWRDAIRQEVPRVLRLDSAVALGGWLARMTVSTGILDAGTLRRLLVRPDGDGFIVDPDRVNDAYAPEAMLELMESTPRKEVPDQVVLAADVTRDTLERWTGWKRFVREVQTIPGNRGRDVDIAFSTAEIRDRVARWYHDAVQLARAEPGRWQLVIAGDGIAPQRDGEPDGASAVHAAHRAAVGESGLRYQRIQHVQGTHLAWMKDFLSTLGARPGAGEPVSLCWEAEHGGTVNVILLARRVDDVPVETWSIGGWTIERCAVVVHDPGHGRQDGLGLFTEPDHRGQLNQELVHFGRAHCEGLLHQAGWRISGRAGPTLLLRIETAVIEQIGRWVAAFRAERARVLARPAAERPGYLARMLGVADLRAVEALLVEVEAGGADVEIARRVWNGVSQRSPATSTEGGLDQAGG